MPKNFQMKLNLIGFVTPALAIGAVLTFAACGSSNGGKTALTQAIPTEIESKLNKCANDKLAVQDKTYAGTPRSVCRVDGNGKFEAHELRPLFAAAKLNGRIKLRQEIVVNLDFVDASGTLLKIAASKRSGRETDVNRFLSDACRPIVKNILGRSGLASSFYFRRPVQGDGYASPATTGASGATATDADDNVIQGPESRVVPPKKTVVGGTTTEKNETQIETTRTVVVKEQAHEFHMVLALANLEDGQLKLIDEIDPVLSGAISIEKTGELSEPQKLFCGQIATRIIENFGLVEGRDCESRSKKVGECAVAGKTAGECVHTQSTAGELALVENAADLTATAAAVVIAEASAKETTLSEEKTAEKTAEKTDETVAAAPSEGAAKSGAEKDSSKGIFKAVQSGTDMKTATLSTKELNEVVLPVCGTLEASPIIKK